MTDKELAAKIVDFVHRTMERDILTGPPYSTGRAVFTVSADGLLDLLIEAGVSTMEEQETNYRKYEKKRA